jgi:hypothetical protein
MVGYPLAGDPLPMDGFGRRVHWFLEIIGQAAKGTKAFGDGSE